MDRRLEEAVSLLREGGHSCVILLEGEEPDCSSMIGIKPLMTKLRRDKNAFCGGVIADKVVGKAAALMAVLGGAQAVYGKVMSEGAVEVLEAHRIEYGYDELVPYIVNRTKDGKCPMEETVWEITEPAEAFEALERTIARLMKK